MPKSSPRKKERPSRVKRRRPARLKQGKPSAGQVQTLVGGIADIPKVNVDVTQALSKPRLEAVLFCEHANQTQDLKTNLSGIFERLYVHRETKQSGWFFLFVRVSETAKGLVQITLLDPNGNPVLGVGMDVSEHPFDDKYPKLLQYLDRVAFKATDLGNYWLDVSYKGESIGGAALIVEMRPPSEESKKGE